MPPTYFHHVSRLRATHRTLRLHLTTHSFKQFSVRCRLSAPTDTQPPRSKSPGIKENIYTLPNLLTISRIAACPVLGWSVLDGNFPVATSLLVYAGITDLVGPLISHGPCLRV
jgi:hypothetical protein